MCQPYPRGYEILIVIVLITVFTGTELSASLILNEYVPIFVGVPRNVPLLLSVRPGGSAPDILENFQGCFPPHAASDPAYRRCSFPGARKADRPNLQEAPNVQTLAWVLSTVKVTLFVVGSTEGGLTSQGSVAGSMGGAPVAHHFAAGEPFSKTVKADGAVPCSEARDTVIVRVRGAASVADGVVIWATGPIKLKPGTEPPFGLSAVETDNCP